MNFKSISERNTFFGFTIGEITNILIVLGGIVMFLLNYNTRLVKVESVQENNTKSIEKLSNNLDYHLLVSDKPVVQQLQDKTFKINPGQ